MDYPYSFTDAVMTSVCVIIPTIGLSQCLAALIDTCWQSLSVIEVHLYDNRKEMATLPATDSRTMNHWIPGRSFYGSWNEGVAKAADRNAYALLLNDDIVIPNGIIEALADALDHYPEYGLIAADGPIGQAICQPGSVESIYHGYRRHEFAAWCCMARPEAWQTVDERYRVYFGDDDLLWKVRHSGWETGILRGVGVYHDTSTTLRQLDWIDAAIIEDQRLWQSVPR